MKILKTIGIVLAGILALVCIAALFMPKQAKTPCSITINAPKEVVWSHISTLKAQNEWSPWPDLDPNLKQTFEGTDGTVGAKNTWVGNDAVGEGYQIISAIEDMKSIKNDLYFIKPFEGQANATLEISEAQEGVKVDWIFSIDMPYPFNALAPFMGDNGVGADFNRGLEKLKKQCEAQSSTAVAGAVDIKEENIAGRKFVGIKSKVSIAESANWYRTNIAKVAAMLKAKGKEPNESPAGLYFVWDDKAGTTEMAAVYPAPAGMTVADKGFELFDLPAGKYAVNDFMGPYDQRMFAAHEALGKHSKQMTTGKMPVVEVYKVAPANTPDSTKWHTRIMYPM